MARKKTKRRKPAAGLAATRVRVASEKRRPALSRRETDVFDAKYRPLIREIVLDELEDFFDVRAALKAEKEPGPNISHEEVKRLLGL